MVGRADLVYFFVSDMDRAVAFYRDVLELELIRRSGEEWSQLAAGSVQVGLHGAGSGPVRPGGTLAFTVEDLDATKVKLVERGVVVGHEGGGDGLGPRFVEFNDPDGNVLALFEYQEARVRGRRVAVIGAGMTKFVRRAQETGKELSWQAANAALQSCELSLADIDIVCSGSAPDAFDGVHRKGDYLADGCGAVGKPYIRTYVGGGTGVFAPIQGWYTVASGMADVALVVCEEKMSSCQPHPQGAFITIFDNIIERPLGPNLLWIFALEMNRYMQKYGLDKRDIAEVAVKNKRNAADHPAALLGQSDITVDDVLASEVLAWPVQRLDVSPISDGAVAIVMASEEAARRLTDKPVWVDGVGWNLDTTYWTNRDLAYPEYVENAARMAYDMAGITEPRKQIHVAEPYDPFDYKELHHLEGLMLFDKGKAPEAARDGVTARDGDLPCCPSGGLLGVGNPIAAAGLMKIAELFWQLRGEAGARQVPGHAGARCGAGVGRPDAGRDGRRHGLGWGGSGWRAAGWWRRPRSACPAIPYPAPRGRRHLQSLDLADQPSVVGCGLPLGRRIRRRRARHLVRVGRRARRWARSWRDSGMGGSSPRIACRASARLVPPRKFCERCFRPTDRWEEVAATGVVETFSICHVSWDMQPVDPPELPGRDPAGRGEPGRVPAQAGRGGAGRRRDRDGGRGRVASARGTDRLDPGHRVLPAGRGRWSP